MFAPSSRRRGVSIPHERILLGLLFALEIGAVILAGVAIQAWLLG
jgi:hypothetical protein